MPYLKELTFYVYGYYKHCIKMNKIIKSMVMPRVKCQKVIPTCLLYSKHNWI